MFSASFSQSGLRLLPVSCSVDLLQEVRTPLLYSTADLGDEVNLCMTGRNHNVAENMIGWSCSHNDRYKAMARPPESQRRELLTTIRTPSHLDDVTHGTNDQVLCPSHKEHA